MSILGGLGGTIGESYGQSGSVGQSYGSSANYGYNWGEGSSWEDSYSMGENWSNSWSDAENSSWNRTFGREASAADIYRAEEANKEQQEMWAMQAMYNAHEAEKSRQYQSYMSNTAYQRAVKDLLAAGLNPILAVGNIGASTPVGATASSGLASSHKASTYAESQGGSYGYSKSESSSYGYNKSESHGGSKHSSYGQNWGSSSNTSYNSSYGYEMSKTSNNIAEVGKKTIQSLTDVYKGGTAASLYNSMYNKIKGTHDHESGRKLKGGQRTV